MSALFLPAGTVDALDRRRRAFLWSGQDTVHGSQCLVAWEKVCTSKLEGSSWASWVRQRVDVHTLDGDVHGAHWDAIRSLLPAYRQIAHVVVHNGGTTAFWEDKWTGNAPLCSTFLVLYSHVLHHGANVSAVAAAGLDHFLAPRLSIQARSELDSIQHMLDSWEPDPGVDVRRCALEGAGHRLITSKIYKLATSSTDA
ncbi:hypothetical protein PVAP13_3NG177961 [Panicum virgatum]|uniref:Uncharacterized protein n=1 Tax=Panicum virgatum TaxID=38727 RepID=A0A8T0U7I1_PANVG|nr:hypothetical protein PVAP13_3NG177961 [Panicum virgatum]